MKRDQLLSAMKEWYESYEKYSKNNEISLKAHLSRYGITNFVNCFDIEKCEAISDFVAICKILHSESYLCSEEVLSRIDEFIINRIGSFRLEENSRKIILTLHLLATLRSHLSTINKGE